MVVGDRGRHPRRARDFAASRAVPRSPILGGGGCLSDGARRQFRRLSPRIDSFIYGRIKTGRGKNTARRGDRTWASDSRTDRFKPCTPTVASMGQTDARLARRDVWSTTSLRVCCGWSGAGHVATTMGSGTGRLPRNGVGPRPVATFSGLEAAVGLRSSPLCGGER